MPPVSRYAFAVIALHAVLIPLGVTAEWPAQFDPSNDPDAGAEWATRGTAVSAPLLPLILLAAGGLLARRRGRGGGFGLALLAVAGILMAIGSIGELLADANETPRAVLTAAGVVGTSLAVGLLALVAAEARRRRRATAAGAA